MRRRYWMVHCPEYGPPTVRHPSEAAARDEAKRLARRNPGCVFYVLEAVDAFAKVEVQRVQLDSSPGAMPDDLPF